MIGAAQRVGGRGFEFSEVDPIPTRVCARVGCSELSIWHVCLLLRRATPRRVYPDPFSSGLFAGPLAVVEPAAIRITTAFGVCEAHREELSRNPSGVFSRAEWINLQRTLEAHGRSFDPQASTLDPTPIGADA